MKLVVTGHKAFLDRYKGLLTALSAHMISVEALPSGNLMEILPVRICARLVRGTPAQKWLGDYLQSFARRSFGFELGCKQTERKISKLGYRPDFVLHIFGSFAPFRKRRDIPFGMYLDFTMALAAREWPPWAEFRDDKELAAWLELETRSYERASVLFTMGNNAKQSLISDYKMSERKVHIVGSAGDFELPYQGKKSFGSRQILFQGSEFERKGGDILLQAFRLVRRDMPEARLVIVGSTLQIEEEGVTNLGYVAERARMEELFLASDLVVAPARCDPFTAFVIEAMNFGVPCVVTRMSGISEVITQDVDGVVEECLDPARIATTIIRLLADPQRLGEISVKARQLVASRLNWAIVAETLAREIRALVPPSGDPTAGAPHG